MPTFYDKILSSLGLIGNAVQTHLPSTLKYISEAKNSIIPLCREGRLREAMDAFHDIYKQGITVDSDTFTYVLQACASLQAAREGKQLHSHMIITGIEQNDRFKTELVNLYAKCNIVEDVRQVFDEISEPDVFCWNTVIRCYSKHRFFEKALNLYNEMQKAGTHMDEFTFPCILKACAGLSALREGKKIHVGIIRSGFDSEIFVCNALVDMYAKCGSIKDARQVFDEMLGRDLVSWNAMISGYSQSSHYREALGLFHHMLAAGLGPDSVTITSILPACANLTALQQGKEIHGCIVKKGVGLDSFVENALVDMYAKCGRVDDACTIFDKMAVKNVVSWNSMIVAFAQNDLCSDALSLFRQMQLEGFGPNPVTILSILPSCGNLAALQAGREIHCYVMRSRFDADVAVGNALIAMYAQCESMENARQVFREMPQRDVCSWTSMIAGYAQNNCPDDAFDFFHRMQQADVKANSITIVSLVTACADSSSLQQVKETHDYVIRHGHEVDAVVGNALMAMYARCGNVEYARHIFDRTSERSMISWNTMLAAYAQNGYGDLALKLLCQMPVAGIKPNSVAIASVLPACAYIAGLQQGKEIHGFILRSGFESDVFVGSAVVDMYAKCGSINDACQVFKKMYKRDVVAWTAMIVGYAMHGHAETALTLFSQMQPEGLKPNKITFTGVLSACSHAGLVDEGRQFFDLMSKDYDITPSMEHYACMVDLLGRAGLLDEAHDFIKSMPFKPSARVWGALLGACKIHSNIDLGKHVAEQLFHLERESTGNYVLLANMYAASGRWDDVDMVRKTMKEKGLIKNPGCSWIVVKSRVHVFLSGDTSHPQLQEIHAMLESLAGQIKEAGCALDQNDKLFNVEEDEEDNMLYSIY